jgi:hypothetical protein
LISIFAYIFHEYNEEILNEGLSKPVFYGNLMFLSLSPHPLRGLKEVFFNKVCGEDNNP